MSSTLSTFIWETINFLILVALLYRLLYKPVRRFIRQRQEQMEVERKAAEEMKRQAEELRSQYQRKLKDLEEEKKAILAETRAHAEEEAGRVVEEARKRAQALRQATDRRVALQLAQARAQLMEAVKQTTLGLVQRVAEFAGADAAHPTALAEIDRLLGELPEERKRETAQLLAEHGATVCVAAAPPLDDNSRQLLTDTIAKHIPFDGEINFEIEHNPHLIAGLEVQLGNLLLKAHWRDRFERLAAEVEEEMGREESASPGSETHPPQQPPPAHQSDEEEEKE